MNFLISLVNLWERISWKLWGRRLAIRQIRRMLEDGTLPPPEAPYHSIEITDDSSRDDTGLN